MNTISINPSKAIRFWHIPLITGLLFLILSCVIFFNPASSLETFIIIFSLGFTFTGISEIIFSLINRHLLKNWMSHLTLGVVTAIAGALSFLNPAVTLNMIVYIVAFVILFRSIFKIVFALNIKNQGSANWPFMLLLGVLGILLSFVLLYKTFFAIASIAFLIALTLLLTGLFSIYFSLQLRMLHKLTVDKSFDLASKLEELADDMKKEYDVKNHEEFKH